MRLEGPKCGAQPQAEASQCFCRLWFHPQAASPDGAGCRERHGQCSSRRPEVTMRSAREVRPFRRGFGCATTIHAMLPSLQAGWGTLTLSSCRVMLLACFAVFAFVLCAQIKSFNLLDAMWKTLSWIGCLYLQSYENHYYEDKPHTSLLTYW